MTLSLRELEQATVHDHHVADNFIAHYYAAKSGPTRAGIVFHQGLNVTAAHYEYHNRFLAQQGYAVLSLEAPWHNGPGPFTLDQMVENFYAGHRYVRWEIGAKPVFYAGHSLGATAALAALYGYDRNFSALEQSLQQGELDQARPLLEACLDKKKPDGLLLTGTPLDYRHLVPFQGIVKPLLLRMPLWSARLLANLGANWSNRLVYPWHRHKRQKIIDYPDHKGLHIMYCKIEDKEHFVTTLSSIPYFYGLLPKIQGSQERLVQEYHHRVSSVPKHFFVGGLDAVLKFPIRLKHYRRMRKEYEKSESAQVHWLPLLSHIYATNEFTSNTLRIQHLEHPQFNECIQQCLGAL